MTIKYGNVSFYDDCNGSNGACGDCNNNSMHVAYTNLLTGCIYEDCAELCNKSCGDNIHIINQCTDDEGYVYVHDCFPQTSADCNNSALCFSQTPPLVDLTEGAFLALGGVYDHGRFACRLVC